MNNDDISPRVFARRRHWQRFAPQHPVDAVSENRTIASITSSRSRTMMFIRVTLICVLIAVAVGVGTGGIGGMLSSRELVLGRAGSEVTSVWHLFRHLGGYSPWIPHHEKHGTGHDNDSGDTTIDMELPEECTIDQVHMLSRHAERYPTLSVGIKMKKLVRRLREAVKKTSMLGTEGGVLDFLNDWELFFEVDEAARTSPHLELLTTRGQYAGTERAYASGVVLGRRYRHLLPDSIFGSNNATAAIYSCSCDRVVSTADNFGRGFFGDDVFHNQIAHVIVSDNKAAGSPHSRGGDTLTPVKTCARYRADMVHGRSQGSAMAAVFKAGYLNRAAERLRPTLQQRYGVELLPEDLWTMQEMCGFEILATGNHDAPWCGLFTRQEWEEFAYARDVLHYFRTGPGTPYSEVMGFLYLNATRELLELGPTKFKSIYLSFAHDGDLVPLISALGLFSEAAPLPVSHLVPDRSWKLSTVVPMGGRIVFERISCANSITADRDIGVRLLVNDAVTRVPGCEHATLRGEICPLQEYIDIVDRKGQQVGGFEEACGLDSEQRRRPSFFEKEWTEAGRVHLE
ncbi:histidine phosphatase superfamily [Limtongia smithiae]|uniref:histidine phosphatase superfamily n=1 Tax=Limtongia smithiae TaxID=1125753 RepID=UPI0034CD7E22